ncbi:hypothetical protein [Candidatus Poriferisodalis sp.]|uniref:hypothetical protein n=1 Tax=Candidatus Poriferisodalis sp. TaxID=3101277 RepID=UPI003B52A5BE
MSEQDRVRLYRWLCEQADEQMAEYLMSCLSPIAADDVVTKEFLRAELSRFATKDELNARFDAMRTEHAAQRDADRSEHAAHRAADRSEYGAQFSSVRAESKSQFRWLVGIMVTMFGLLMAAMFGLAAVS